MTYTFTAVNRWVQLSYAGNTQIVQGDNLGTLSWSYPNITFATKTNIASPLTINTTVDTVVVNGVTFNPGSGSDAYTALVTLFSIFSLNGTESDPVFTASAAYLITSANINSWNAAHASTWTDIIGRPSFATVATSGSYTDLINKPDLSGVSGGASSWGSITGTLSSQTDLQAALNAKQAAGSYAAFSHTHAFSVLTGKPTTLSGYGITDAYPLTGNPSSFLSSADLSSYETQTHATATYVAKIVGKGLSTEDYTTVEKTKLAGIATSATANSTDATLLSRANHTGTQTASTVSDFQTAVSVNTDVTANTTARHTHSNKTLLDSYTQTEVNLADAVAKKHSHTNTTALNAVSGTNTGDETTTRINALYGYTPADAAALAGKQNTLTLTTTGASGAATLIGSTLNIPQYSGGGSSTTLTDNLTTSTTGTALDAHQGFVLKGLIDTNTTSISSKEPTITAGTTAQYWRGDKSWQTLNSAAVGLGSVENTALSTWAGSSNITTLGTIATGTWSGTTIGVTKGGSGLSSATLGDIHYGSAANTLAALAGNTTSTKKFLTQTGTGTVSAAPGWNTIVASDIPDISATYATQSQLTTTNTAVSGKQPQLSGTGFVKASGTTISYDNSTYLTANQTVTLSGDISGSGATAITTAIGAGKVTNTMLAGSIAASKLVGSDITIAESQVTNLTTDLAAKVGSTTDNVLAIASGVLTTRKAFATATDGATTTLNCATGMNWWWTIAGNRTLAISNPQDGDIITVYIVQDATGSRTVTWPTGIVWINGSAPTLKTAGASIDRITFQYRLTNTTWYASY